VDLDANRTIAIDGDRRAVRSPPRFRLARPMALVGSSRLTATALAMAGNDGAFLVAVSTGWDACTLGCMYGVLRSLRFGLEAPAVDAAAVSELVDFARRQEVQYGCCIVWKSSVRRALVVCEWD